MIKTEQELIFYAGGSMWPTFRPGDRLVLDHCNAAELCPGEVVVYRGGNGLPRSTEVEAGPKLVIHRVLSVSESNGGVRVRTQGDCSPRADREWPGERLVGRVVQVLPVKGKPRRLKASPFLGWRLRHKLSVRRITRAIRRRLRGH